MIKKSLIKLIDNLTLEDDNITNLSYSFVDEKITIDIERKLIAPLDQYIEFTLTMGYKDIDDE